MKKLLAFVVIVAGLVMVPNVSAANSCSVADSDSGSVACITNNNGTTKYYTDFNVAINEAVDGDLLVLMDYVNIQTSYIARLATKSTFSLDLNGFVIDANVNGSYGFYIADGSTVTIKDSSTEGTGTIKNSVGKTALVIQSGTVILEGGNYESNNPSMQVIQVGGLAKLIVKNANIKGQYLAIGSYGNNAEIFFEGGKITADYGIALFGNNGKLTVSGGTITANGYAVLGNGSDTTNTTINITGGTLTGGNAAIYQPQTGTTTISGGKLTGAIGIVSRQGTINITGGKIIANGDGSKTRIGDAKDKNGEYVLLTTGIAVIVDNTENAYEDNATVSISGGTFQSTVSPVLSYGNVAEDITVSGGTFNQKVNGMYLALGVVQNDDGTVKTPSIETEKNDKKDDVSKTGDVFPTSLIIMTIIAALAGTYTFKKN